MTRHIKNIVTDESKQQDEFEYDLQEFIIKRIDRIEEKIHIEKLSDQYLKHDTKFTEVLAKIGNDDLTEKIREAAFIKERSSNGIYYSRGFKEGLKLSLMLSKF